MIDEHLHSFLKSNNTIDSEADEIAVGQIPVDSEGKLQAETYIWMQQYTEEDSLDLDGEAGLTEFNFDCEVCGVDTGKTKSLAQAVKKHLQGHAGAFGSGTVQGVFVTDKEEDYLPRNDFGSDELTIVPINIQIFANDDQ